MRTPRHPFTRHMAGGDRMNILRAKATVVQMSSLKKFVLMTFREVEEMRGLATSCDDHAVSLSVGTRMRDNILWNERIFNKHGTSAF